MPAHELTAYGDKELWYVTGSIPEGDWSLPIHVHRYSCNDKKFVRVVPIVAMPAQSAKLKELFSDSSIWSENGQYMVESEQFESIAHKAPGVTPECYRHWPGVETRVPTAFQVQVQASDEPEPENEAGRFLDYVHRKTGISRKLIKMAWWAMAEAAPEWLLTEHKPIDLGYATIYPIPYRADWKDLLLLKDTTIGPVFKLPQEDRDRELAMRGYPAHMWNGDLMAVNLLTHRFYWTLEIVPNKTFEQRSEQVEITQVKFGSNRYVERYEAILAKLLPSILSVFGSWLSKIALPIAKIREGRSSGTRRLAPVNRKRSYYNPNKGILPRIPKYSKGPNNKELCFKKKLRPAFVGVQPVPNIPPGTNDVRECKEPNHVDQSENGTPRDPGLPLPPATQGET